MLIFVDTQVGDEIVCINNLTKWGRLTKGKTYTVAELHEPKGAYLLEWVAVKCDNGTQYWYYESMFEPKVTVIEGWSL